MRMLVVDTEAGIEDKWYAAIQPHWPGGLIDRVENNQQALDQLNGPYFFPLMVCRADRETILAARNRNVKRVMILPCDVSQVVEEINSNFSGTGARHGRDAQVQLHVMYQTLNSLCHGPVTHRQLQWLKQRCSGQHLVLACAAIDQILRYMDRPGHKTAEIKNALLELSGQVQCGIDGMLSPQYA